MVVLVLLPSSSGSRYLKKDILSITFALPPLESLNTPTPHPNLVMPMKTVRITRKGEHVAIQFEYDQRLVEVAKSFPKRKFDPNEKEWLVPLFLYKDVVREFERHTCVVIVDEEIERFLLEGKEFEPEIPEVFIRKVGKDYMISFEYNPSLVREIKTLEERKFDPGTKNWFIPIRDEVGTLKEVISRLQLAGCQIRLHEDLKAYFKV